MSDSEIEIENDIEEQTSDIEEVEDDEEYSESEQQNDDLVEEDDIDEEENDDIDEEENDDIELHNIDEKNNKNISQNKILNSQNQEQYDDDDDDDYYTDDEDEYLQKLDRGLINSYLEETHPETLIHNFDEVKALSKVIRNEQGEIIDELHKTIPILTKFEKTKILGIRAKQLDEGAQPFITVPDTVIDGYTIACEELEKKKMPFIIRRPLPNGGSEYWKVSDLEMI